MLLISFPDNCRAERRWISSVLLGGFLGLDYEIRFDGGNMARMESGGKTLEIFDAFFTAAKDNWLSEASLPVEPLQRWIIPTSGLEPDLVEPAVPVIFGAPEFSLHDTGDGTLGLDVFGSAFFMLSRYEEAVSKQRDNHDRFPATASLAYRERFLNRPIVDEYTEILWAAISRIWPQLERKPREFKLFVTCDVDHPYHAGAASFLRMIKRTAGELIRKRTLRRVAAPAINYFASKVGDWKNDPYYYTVDWMMDVNEKVGNRVAFNFIPEITDPRMDDTCAITDHAVRAMLKRIAYRGHEIGIHPGFNTYQNPKNIISGKNRLQGVLDEAGIRQEVIGGRQHYLRWATKTPALWDAAGLEYDSTLGYSDYAGFRCGTCHEYGMYDLHARKDLKLTQRPLIVMEMAVVAHMGHGYTKAALTTMKNLKSAAKKFKGSFTLLWHNSCLEEEKAREIYCEIIKQ